MTQTHTCIGPLCFRTIFKLYWSVKGLFCSISTKFQITCLFVKATYNAVDRNGLESGCIISFVCSDICILTDSTLERNTCIMYNFSSQNTGFFRKILVKLKSIIGLHNFNTKHEMPVNVINTIPYDFKRYPKFKQN